MSETAQQEAQRVTFPEIRDTADSYAEMPEQEYGEYDSDDNSIDVDIDDMVWEVESEPADDTYAHEDAYNEEVRGMDTAEDLHGGYSGQDSGYAGEYRGRRGEYEEIPYSRKMNKHIFTWLFSCLCGMYGVDRFIRGQIPLGIFKLLTFGGFGFWYLADLGVAIYKSYMEPGAMDQEDLHFDSFGRYV